MVKIRTKWRHLVAKFLTKYLVAKIGTNKSEVTFKLISVRKNDIIYRVNTLGMLCLWQR